VPQGIAMTGGTVEGYKKVLSMFRRDAEERLGLLQNPPDEKDLPLFTTQVHALKSASGSIGAAELSALAAQLEAAGKGALAGNAGDLAAITEKLPGFTAQLAALAEDIRNLTTGLPATAGSLTNLTDREEKITDQESVGSVRSVVNSLSVFNPLLSELAKALETKDMKKIDAMLEEIEKLPLDADMQKKIEAVSDQVLVTDFGKALMIIEEKNGGVK
jgi:HPt (histidine-containing phosphotransfer) domain-containing protein